MPTFRFRFLRASAGTGPVPHGAALRAAGPRRWRLRERARSTVSLVLAVVLVTQLERSDAMGCELGEYPQGTECCPMCAAGWRVFKHCTANSSTTCIPCVEGTYTDHPNGLTYCRTCKLCDEGADLVTAAACTYTKNTVCGCRPGHFCSSPGPEGCELCQPYTVCVPGTVVKEWGKPAERRWQQQQSVPFPWASGGTGARPIPSHMWQQPRGTGRPLRWRQQLVQGSVWLVLAVALVTQLERSDATGCELGEYPNGTKCCPTCAAVAMGTCLNGSGYEVTHLSGQWLWGPDTAPVPAVP
ncbi:LOW QUALITY PROTEIN: tumor necrosis factor receptor superfamily member 14 [Empidonax traillii]|uniref:LOW QUALITY PROTEIN: tumor necrosis factor receptor superfamily member 14 n=1 Tax=Empidonax traillii TaxID=164674 RepID=UPI000FFD4FC1|nr:LOW QUALITY PROTEIN: tumor necrosis factor receptor superfamily member 14 [Empidonax traillii]